MVAGWCKEGGERDGEPRGVELRGRLNDEQGEDGRCEEERVEGEETGPRPCANKRAR
jgi:hypothetical protein